MPDDSERTVTDPVTHQRVKVHDATDIELEQIPPPPSLTEENKHSHEDRRAARPEQKDMTEVINELVRNSDAWWDDPLGDQSRTRIQTALIAAGAAGVGSFGGLIGYGLITALFGQQRGFFAGMMDVWFSLLGSILLAAAVGAAGLSFHVFQEKRPRKGTRGNGSQDPFQDPKSLKGDRDTSKLPNDPESAIWLNTFLKTLWPLINPSLFTAVCDMLEDSLQASMPALIQGVKVADLGQGSEPVRILGVRCLDKESASEDKNGFEAEIGEFVNLEVALGYRAKDTSDMKGLRARAANLHVMMQFWLSGGGFMLPVWVELDGLLAVARIRVQLMSSPPFLSLATITLLGAPKIQMKATPLKRGFMNVMNVPGLSSWLQSTIDATIRDMVVAPRSMTIDLKATLMGELEKDTHAVGVVVVTIRKAILKMGGSAKHDAYVTVGWSKLGKPLWSSRIITDTVVPVWEETMFVLVGPEELNIQEGVKVEVWDSDRFTADDLLGCVDVPIHTLMHDDSTKNNITRREDKLVDDRGREAQGDLSITWEVGYFEKTSVREHRSRDDVEHIRKKVDKKAEAMLKEAIDAIEIGEEQQEDSEDKDVLKAEVEQQKEEDMVHESNELIANERPLHDYLSGVLSIEIEQITGLEVQQTKASGVKPEAEQEGSKDDTEDTDGLPSAYCTVIINDRKAYRTRTKMMDDNPYFGAKTEKFIRNWRTTTVIISVRDSRFHETNPLLGVVVLPLPEIFKRKNSSIFEETLPIMGGIGYGRMKLRLLFRSVKLTLPKRLRGWDIGTVEVFSGVMVNLKDVEDGSKPLDGCHMKFKIGSGAGDLTGKAKGKMIPYHEGQEQRGYMQKWEGQVTWVSKTGKPVRLPIRNRYASSLVVQFKKGARGPDQVVAFGTLWLKEIPDDEEVQITVPLFSYRLRKDRTRGNEKQGIKYATMNAAPPTDTRVVGDVEGQIENTKNNDEDAPDSWDSDSHGESIGSVELKLRFHSGLSGYHHVIADKDQAMADVMQVLDCVEGTHGAGKDMIRGIDHRSEVQDGDSQHTASTYSDSSSEEDTSDEGFNIHSKLERDENEADEDVVQQGGLKGKVKKIKKHQGDLHRRHRGLMQWKAVRQVAWIGRTVEEKTVKAGERIARPFVGHRDRQIELDTEA